MTYNNGANNVVFENLTLTNWQTTAQDAPIQTGTGWQLLNVVSVYNGGAGLYVGAPSTVIRGGSHSNNGQVGIEGSAADGSSIIGVTADGNNTANYARDWDAGGIKIGKCCPYCSWDVKGADGTWCGAALL